MGGLEVVVQSTAVRHLPDIVDTQNLADEYS